MLGNCFENKVHIYSSSLETFSHQELRSKTKIYCYESGINKIPFSLYKIHSCTRIIQKLKAICLCLDSVA